MRIAVAMCGAAALLQPLALRPHAVNALLYELDLRAGAFPTGVSASNLVVVGGLDGGGGFYWRPVDGGIFNGGVAAQGVSGDGSKIVGVAEDHGGIRQAALWLQRTEWQLLGSFSPTAVPCDTSLSAAYGVSRDGQVIVGSASDGCALSHAFRWTA